MLGIEHRDLFEEFRDFALEQVRPYAAAFDAEGSISRQVIDRLASARLLGARLPVDQGGRALDPIGYGLLHEAIGAVCTSTRSLITVHDMVVHTICRWADPEQKATWLPRLTGGRAIAAFALTEAAAGSDVGAIQARAVRVGEDYVLNGTKKWISFGSIADVFLVFARVGSGVSGFLVPRDTPGLSVAALPPLLGARASLPSEVVLDGCRLTAASVISPRGRAIPQVVTSALTLGRLGVSAGCAGMLQACLDEVHVANARPRGTAPPVRDHQLVQRMVADMVTDIEAARLLWVNAASLMTVRDPRTPMAMMFAKYFAAAAAGRGTRSAVQMLGAEGCTDKYCAERFFRDAKVMEIIEGTTEIQQITIGRWGYAGATAMFSDPYSHGELGHERC